MRKSLYCLILLTVALSLIATLLPSVRGYLALSWTGIKNLYLWQLITYVFVEPGPLSFGALLQLAFNMYILWMFGTPLIDFSHPRLFFLLYFGAALLAALSILPLHGTLAGSTTAVYAILVAWMMVNQGSRLMLFFTLPFKAEWLIVGIIAFTLFIDISAGLWVPVVSLIASSLFGYLFALIVWRQQGPFAILRPFEKKVFRLLERKKAPYSPSKIYDIRSGAPILNDDQFMDAMLDQISRLGEKSLTPEEKKRMHAISAKKK